MLIILLKQDLLFTLSFLIQSETAEMNDSLIAARVLVNS